MHSDALLTSLGAGRVLRRPRGDDTSRVDDAGLFRAIVSNQKMMGASDVLQASISMRITHGPPSCRQIACVRTDVTDATSQTRKFQIKIRSNHAVSGTSARKLHRGADWCIDSTSPQLCAHLHERYRRCWPWRLKCIHYTSYWHSSRRQQLLTALVAELAEAGTRCQGQHRTRECIQSMLLVPLRHVIGAIVSWARADTTTNI